MPAKVVIEGEIEKEIPNLLVADCSKENEYLTCVVTYALPQTLREKILGIFKREARKENIETERIKVHDLVAEDGTLEGARVGEIGIAFEFVNKPKGFIVKKDGRKIFAIVRK
ncbi:MAG: hypothetical protein DRN25_07355 [Thermoplasmata archaeon]|nr:MAG: hypothetical protein DRN25_07355 [Thermoplasmata archaeon]